MVQIIKWYYLKTRGPFEPLVINMIVKVLLWNPNLFGFSKRSRRAARLRSKLKQGQSFTLESEFIQILK